MVIPNNFREQVLARLQERGVRVECELCGKNDWLLVEHPVSVPVASGSANVLTSPFRIPSVSLICKNCGNMRLLALGALDLLPDQAPLQQNEAASLSLG